MKYIVFICVVALSSCALGVSESPNISNNIAESKRTKVFKCEYTAIQTPDSLFTIKEIWIERAWQNKCLNPFFYKRILGDYCNLAISVNELPESKYNNMNFGSWYLFDSLSSQINSLTNWKCTFEISNCELRDTIPLVLVTRDSTGNKNVAGNILMIRKN